MHLTTIKIAGFSILEVLIALFILITAFLALAKLQIIGLKHNQSASFLSQATILSADIFDRMRANKAAVQRGDYFITLAADIPAVTRSMADKDHQQWLTDLAAVMPEGDGKIECDPCGLANVVTVTIQWSEPDRNGGLTITSFSYSSQL